MSTLDVPELYPYVMLLAVLIVSYCFILGLISVLKSRKSIFTTEFMEKNFGKVHKEAFNEDLTHGSYPDMGNGYYSKKLSYKDWYIFNKV